MDDAENEKWIEYISDLLKSMQIMPPSRILETACGTGRITLPLVQSGYDVIALDLSKEMLNIAQEKLQNAGVSTHFIVGDMIQFILPKPVNAIICVCDGVNYLMSDTDVCKYFNSCRCNLEIGGVLLFDISSYNKLTKTLGNNLFYDDRENVTCLWQNRLLGDLLQMELTLFIREGNNYHRKDEEQFQRAYRIKKIKQMLQEAGFGQIESFNYFTKNEATEESERIQFIAVKER
jgi:ubiquinone/menaquinone biosynthesis C-methylase UbiE